MSLLPSVYRKVCIFRTIDNSNLHCFSKLCNCKNFYVSKWQQSTFFLATSDCFRPYFKSDSSSLINFWCFLYINSFIVSSCLLSSIQLCLLLSLSAGRGRHTAPQLVSIVMICHWMSTTANDECV